MVRLNEEQRRNVITTAALRIARDNGIWAVTHETVAKRCTVVTSPHTVKHYFPRKEDLWEAAIAADDSGRLRAQMGELE